MGSILHRGVRLQIFPDDHEPRHAHCFVGDAAIVVDFHDPDDIHVADRGDAVRGAKGNDAKKAVTAASERYDDLVKLWETMHG